MKCTDVRAVLPLLIYDEPNGEDSEIRQHLAHCPDCRREHEAFQSVRRLLDEAPVPHVAVDLPRLHRSLSERQLRREKRWQRAALVLGALAAVLLFAIGLRLEVRLEANQFVVRWGDVPPPAGHAFRPDTAVSENQVGKSDVREDLHLLSDLIHALRQDAEERDERFTERLDRLQKHVHVLQSQSDLRWNNTEKDMAALYLLTRKGEKP